MRDLPRRRFGDVAELKSMFRRDPEIGEIKWIEAADNPWGVDVLDVRPMTLGTLSVSINQQDAVNAISFGQDDGTGFIGDEPPVSRRVDVNLQFPTDRRLADGALFIPREMEDKWAIYHHCGEFIFVQNWLRQVKAVATVEQHSDHIEVTSVNGGFGWNDENPEFTVRALEFLLRTHALGASYPAPLPASLELDPQGAASWCMATFGNRAEFATPHRIAHIDPDQPLRTFSLLHIAVAHRVVAAIEARLAA